MASAGLTRPMSKKGCTADNTTCKGFFRRLKNEVYYKRNWGGTTVEQFIVEFDRYICWYSGKPIRISLDAMNPVEYRSNLGVAA